MASYDGVSDLGQSAAAGWRAFAKLDDLAWIQSKLATDATGGGIEAAIALATLFPGGVPASGAEVAVVVYLCNKDGTALSNQTLPQQDSPASPAKIAKLVIRL